MLEKFGENMKQDDIEDLIRTADRNGDGHIDYEGQCDIEIYRQIDIGRQRERVKDKQTDRQRE